MDKRLAGAGQAVPGDAARGRPGANRRGFADGAQRLVPSPTCRGAASGRLRINGARHSGPRLPEEKKQASVPDTGEMGRLYRPARLTTRVRNWREGRHGRRFAL